VDEDDLDSYMASVEANTAVDTAALKESKKRLYDLKLDKARIERLCQLAKPVAMPEVKRLASVPSNICTGKIGKKQSLKMPIKIAMKPSEPSVVPVSTAAPAGPPKPVAGISSKPVPAGPSKPNKKIKMEIKNMFSKPSTSEEPVILPLQVDVTEIPGAMGSEEEMKDEVPEEVTEGVTEGVITPSDKDSDVKLTEFTSTEPTKPSPSKGKRRRGRKGPTATLTDDIKWDDGDEADPDFVNWVPPKNQSGDGRTSLNDKFGY